VYIVVLGDIAGIIRRMKKCLIFTIFFVFLLFFFGVGLGFYVGKVFAILCGGGWGCGT